MLINLAIWYLRARKKSVIIGYKLRKEEIQALYPVAYIYDNDINLDEVSYLDEDGSIFMIPEGKFDTRNDKCKDI